MGQRELMVVMALETASLPGPLRKRESHLWQRDFLDWYCEPSWVADRLFRVQPFVGEVIDPACGRGNIVEAARRAHHAAEGWDIVDRGFPGTKVRDFLTLQTRYCNFVCNPPFGIAEHFVAHAIELARNTTCMLLPANWVQGDKRSRWLETTPLARVLFITPRPSIRPVPQSWPDRSPATELRIMRGSSGIAGTLARRKSAGCGEILKPGTIHASAAQAGSHARRRGRGGTECRLMGMG